MSSTAATERTSPFVLDALYELSEPSTLNAYLRGCKAVRIDKRSQYRIKRAIDLLVSVLILITLSPLLLLIGILIKLTSPGPILYRQRRLGQNGFEFVLLKFRTMVVDADDQLGQLMLLNEASGPLFKIRRDPRVTPLGRVLRRTFFDEVPQVINVIRGDMSLVGPRPILAREAKQIEKQLLFRFAVPQGITGPWQVNGHHGISFHEQLRAERDYVDAWSLKKDFQILIKTVPLILKTAGV